ncbi:hypothetical protein [Francisella sp. LA112445]|uniref:hypothetical protein n=1 Tax=Francisella sp. LA112445 TaxID=1395624 RepID=UPI001788E5EF|nr:hypothetical protein [Francisella sp. LA112445]QIW10320.1 hypothetical protein FIP56_06270 [Francisella sp. LA112445]
MSKSIVTEGKANIISIDLKKSMSNLKYKLATFKLDNRILKDFSDKLLKKPKPHFDVDDFKDYLSINGILFDDLSSEDVTKLIISYQQENAKS